jgi:uncharacterized membrane protein YjjP (DUF1212 family)
LLEYNESTSEIHRALALTAPRLSDGACKIEVSYGRLEISLGDDGHERALVRELRFNTAVQARVHEILGNVRRGEVELEEALCQLKRVEAGTPRHARWLVALLLGAAAASLARLLGADGGAAAATAIAAGVGLLARQELGRRRFSILAQPFVAGVIGALIGGGAIRAGWTSTPGLALIVPALVLVPGPHIINGLLDVVDNYIPMAVARLTLAASILLVTALGVTLGMELILSEIPRGETRVAAELSLVSDMTLAGIVTCGFAVAYNTAWRHLAMAAVGGMFGHGLRFLVLQWGLSQAAATFLGALCVGVVSACMAWRTTTPVAVIAFAGAVTMMPGLQMYRALGGALRLAQMADPGDVQAMAETVGYGLQACVASGALALGLVVGVRAISLISALKTSDHSLPTFSC